MNFTYEGKKWEEGQTLKKIIEVALTNKPLPFHVIERQEMSLYFEKLQEERNLYKDLLNEFNNKPQLAGVDYIVVGDVNHNFATEKYILNITFIKFTGTNATMTLPLIIELSKEQLEDEDQIRKAFNRQLPLFYNNYFVEESNKKSLDRIPDFYIELEKRDSVISSLKKDVNNIRDYAYVARLNMLGSEFGPGGDVEFNTPLSILMKNIFEMRGTIFHLKHTDSALDFSNQVIKEYPKYPFGYYSKAFILLGRDKNSKDGLQCAKLGVQILEITTKIDGHNPNHDEGLKNLKALLTAAQN